jgi:uridine kinase
MHPLSHIRSEIRRLLEEKESVLVAIDGNCTAGKTTLADKLLTEFDCNVFHMDEFFLQPHQRTRERLAEAGGNVDYERFYEEVLLPLRGGSDFSYRPYSCKHQMLADPVAVLSNRLTVVEGTYSTHPYFQKPYDLTVFLTIDPQTQQQRVGMREAWKQEMFKNVWIPMEQAYFDHFHVRENCDLVL